MTISVWLMEDGFFSVRDSEMDTQPDTANWTRIARYDETAHPVLHQKLQDNVLRASWNAQTQELVIDGVVEINAAWIQAAESAVATAIANETEGEIERSILLEQADVALTQIANERQAITADLVAITNGKTVATNASTLAQMRTVILSILDGMERICKREGNALTREDRTIKVLRAEVRRRLDE